MNLPTTRPEKVHTRKSFECTWSLNPFGRAAKLQVLAGAEATWLFRQVNDFSPNLKALDPLKHFQRAFVEEFASHRILQDIEHPGSIEFLLETDIIVETIVRFGCNEILSEGLVLRSLDYFILQF
jgi:hypothetical protein